MIMSMRIPSWMKKQGMMISNNNLEMGNHPKEKVIVIMGATGSGKSRLSIDLATHFPNSEIINSDKMQLYQGLDILTNKIPLKDQRQVPHHLLSIITTTTTTPSLDIPISKFCHMASLAAASIVRRRRLPIIVGGSNSYIEALLDNYSMFYSKYQCCLLWVDVAMPLLHSYVSDRVDKMVARGLVEEARELFDEEKEDYSCGIRKAIGVRELDRYFRSGGDDLILEEGIKEIKENSCELALRQVKKILRLGNVKGWNIHRMDATEVFRKKGKFEEEEAWGKHVSGPSIRIVSNFLTTPTQHQHRHQPLLLNKPPPLIKMSLAAAAAP